MKVVECTTLYGKKKRIPSEKLNLSFFFLCHPLSTEVREEHQEPTEETEKPAWLKISELRLEDFATNGGKIWKRICKELKVLGLTRLEYFFHEDYPTLSF